MADKNADCVIGFGRQMQNARGEVRIPATKSLLSETFAAAA
jgi:hypothetical protein